MPAHLTPIPRELAGTAFTARQAERLGVSRRTLQHERFAQPYYGVFRLVGVAAGAATVAQGAAPLSAAHSGGDANEAATASALDYLPLLRPGEAFSHVTALLIIGAPIRVPPAVHVTRPAEFGRVRRRGVHGHTRAEPFEILRARQPDLPIVRLELALLQSACELPFDELVVAVDHLIAVRGVGPRRRAMLTKGEIEAFIDSEGRGARGAAKLRAALRVARVGAESRMETLLHLELARLGLDDLVLQHEIYDADGRFIGRFDSVDPVAKLIIEYDGEQHRTDRAQYLKDEKRLERARQAGFRVLRLHKEDFSPLRIAETMRRVMAFLGREARPIDAVLARYLRVR